MQDIHWISTARQRHCRKRIPKQRTCSFFSQGTGNSRVLLIFLNEVISLIFGPWSKTNLGFGNSSVFSPQQLPEKNWRMELLLFPLFFLCYLASASVTYCLQELHGNSWSWWQHLCICYTRSRETASVQIQTEKILNLANLSCVISQNRAFFWLALAARYKPNLKGEFGNVDFSSLQYEGVFHLQTVLSWVRSISYS